MKLRAQTVLSAIGITLCCIGLCSIFIAFFALAQLLQRVTIGFEHPSNSMIPPSLLFMLVMLGTIFSFAGWFGPIKVIRSKIRLPAEIDRMIRLQAVILPSSGFLLLFIASSPYLKASFFLVQLALAVLGSQAILSGWLGFIRLSKTLPRTFYIDEMIRIFKSTGIGGTKDASPADHAFSRWTTGRAGVSVNEKAPDGRVILISGEQVLLSKTLKSGTTVINFGSYTCPHHRKRLGELQDLMKRWSPIGINFITIYIAEAHPEDGWALADQYINDPNFSSNSNYKFYYAQTIEDRILMAKKLVDTGGLRMPVTVDSIENTLLKSYNAWPIRLYVVEDMIIKYAGQQGPFGYSITDVERFLLGRGYPKGG